MSFLGNIFGRKSEATQAPRLTPPPASPPPPGAPAMMKVWDAYGRIGEIPREEWRTQVLPINFQNAWNKPDDLGNLINVTLNDGFIPDCLEPARRLCRIDTQPKRAINLLAFVLIKLNKFDEAETIIKQALQRHGKDSLLLNNLAKVHSGRGNQALVESTLWDSLQAEPNVENSFGWYVAIHRERAGEDAALEAMRRVAALPGSWRAQLWLARAALQSRELDQALAMYRECLSRAAKPVPGDLLMQMSGDLGNAAHLPELLQMVEPHFAIETHGLNVGNNLIKAHLDLGQIDAARRIVDQLYALKRPDWKENLSFWDTEIAKMRIATSTPERKEPMKVAILTIDGPVWLKPSSPAGELFPAQSRDGSRICILGCTAEIATNSKRIQHQMSDTPGRMSRALPLFLTEQVEFNSNARVQTLIPWIAEKTGGFVLGGGPWNDEDAANYARQGEVKNDYVVIIHLKPNAEPWTVELRLTRTIDAKCLRTLNSTFYFTKPEEGLLALSKQLLTLLETQVEVERVTPPAAYQTPKDPHFSYYLLRLEQLLAVRCGGMDGVQKGFLSGEREIIDGNLQLCLDCPQNVGTRILLAQTLAAFKRTRPEILPEFKEKIELLQREKPLSEPAQGVVQRILNDVLSV